MWTSSVKRMVKIGGAWVDPAAVQAVHPIGPKTRIIIAAGEFVDVALKADEVVRALFRRDEAGEA